MDAASSRSFSSVKDLAGLKLVRHDLVQLDLHDAEGLSLLLVERGKVRDQRA
jgi:hypothetical protein